MRKKEIEQAKVAIEKDGAELSKLKNEESILKGIVKQLKGISFWFYPILVNVLPNIYI